MRDNNVIFTGLGVFGVMALAGTSLAAAPDADARAKPAGDPRPPNVVLFLADDLGYGDPQCLNPESKIPTPHMDRLAEEGMLFRDAHSPSAVCSPTRYGILTGRYCWRTSLKRGVLRPWDPPLIAPDRLTLPDMLRRKGYTTACIGKWHLGWDWPVREGETVPADLRRFGRNTPRRIEDYDLFDFTRSLGNGPTTRGFDTYFGTSVPNYPPYCFIENDRTLGIPSLLKPADMYGNPGPMVHGWRLEPILPTLAGRAVTFIDRHAAQRRDRPFLLYFASTAPHTPIVPDAPFVDESEAGPYGDLVHQVDWTLGQILAALDRNGFTDNTLVIMTSDNGSPGRAGDPHSHGKDFHPTDAVTRKFGHDPNAPWRGKKADIWEGGHRVPLMIRWPGRIPAGMETEQTVCQTDFMATLAKLVDFALPDDAAEDSYDLSPLLLGRLTHPPIREATVHHSGRGMFAIRQGRWKLVLGLGSGGWSKPIAPKAAAEGPAGQLYDMGEDPGETTNLWLERPEVVHRLKRLLETYRSEGRSTPLRSSP